MTATSRVTARAGNTLAQRQYVLLGNLVLTLMVVGYPLSASISQLMGFETNQLNMGFRIVVLLLAMLLGLWSVVRGVYRVDLMILIFLFAYTLRMIWDFTYSLLPSINDDLTFYLATTLLPTLAIGGGRSWYNERLCLRLIAWIGGLGGVLVGFIVFFRPDVTLQTTLDNRAAFHFLNPISIGYHGLYIAAASVMLIASPSVRTRAKLYGGILYGALAVLGACLLIAGGSRGPFVALVLAIGVTGLASTRTTRAYALMAVGLSGLMMVIGGYELILQRFLSSGEDASSIERLLGMNLSIRAMLDHPLLGSAYIEPTTGLYPHNLIIEAGLALGLGGGALMLLISGSMLFSAGMLARRGEWLLPFLAAISLAGSWIAGSIWSAGLFFSLAWLVRDRRR